MTRLRLLTLAAAAATAIPVPARGQRGAAAPPAMAAPPATAAVAMPAADTIGAAVVVRGDTVLTIRAPFGAFSAAERAAAIAARIRGLSNTRVDSVQLVPAEGATNLVAGEVILMSVTDADAAAEGQPREAVARAFAAALADEIRVVSKTETIKTVLIGVAYTLLATLILVAALAALGRFFPRVYAKVESWRAFIPGLRIQKLELLSSAAVADALLSVARFARIVVVIILFYFYLPLVLSFFPWTRPVSSRIVGYVTTPLEQVGTAFLAYLPNIFFIAVIVVVTRYVLKAIHLVFQAMERGRVAIAGFEPEWSEPTYKIVRFLVLAFAAVVLFPYLPGAQSEAFKGISLFIGVLFSLGSSSAISNVVAGVVLTYTRAFNIGDRIAIGDATGDVVAKSLLVTRIRTIKNVDITIPNAMVLSSHIQNYSAMARDKGLILHTTVTIGYDAPWKQVHDLLIAAAKATPNILAKPEPFVLQTSLDDFYVSYQINAYTDDPAIMARTYGQLHANIQDKFNEGGVEIMSPHYRTLRDGNQTTIPADYLPQTYEAPPFRVRQVDGDAGAS